MENIVFRGRIKKNKWQYGLIEFGVCDALTICPQITDGLKSYFVEPKTIGQFIGIKDKNNIKMFEADIVKAWSNLTNKEQLFIVEFDANRLHFGFRPINSGYIYNIDELLIELGEELYFEIVGNIYDNPKLL